MMTPLTIRAGKKQLRAAALLDTGSSVTILSRAYAQLLGIRPSPQATLEIGGVRRKVCYRKVDLHIPGTDCFVEKMRVAVIANKISDIPGALIGVDFMQRTGAFLDFRKNRHAIGGDVNGRDRNPPELVEAKRVRFGTRQR